jgi:formylglycine-generating enzyme required for sulfatase activity
MGALSLRVLRGGSFRDKSIALRSAARFRYDEDVRYYANGFRVARDLN